MKLLQLSALVLASALGVCASSKPLEDATRAWLGQFFFWSSKTPAAAWAAFDRNSSQVIVCLDGTDKCYRLGRTADPHGWVFTKAGEETIFGGTTAQRVSQYARSSFVVPARQPGSAKKKRIPTNGTSTEREVDAGDFTLVRLLPGSRSVDADSTEYAAIETMVRAAVERRGGHADRIVVPMLSKSDETVYAIAKSSSVPS